MISVYDFGLVLLVFAYYALLSIALVVSLPCILSGFSPQTSPLCGLVVFVISLFVGTLLVPVIFAVIVK
jgi:hypothetical protein